MTHTEALLFEMLKATMQALGLFASILAKASRKSCSIESASLTSHTAIAAASIRISRTNLWSRSYEHKGATRSSWMHDIGYVVRLHACMHEHRTTRNQIMNYALVDISTAPRIVDMADTLTEAIAMRQDNFRYRYTHIFRLITANGIQQLSGDEVRLERMTREDIILHDNLLRKQEAEESKRRQREQREQREAGNALNNQEE